MFVGGAGPEACGILAPQPGIQPTPFVLEDKVSINYDGQGSPCKVSFN